MRVFKMPVWCLVLFPLMLFGLAGCIRVMWHPPESPSFTRPALPRFYPGLHGRATSYVYSCTNPTLCFAGVAAFAPSQAANIRRVP